MDRNPDLLEPMDMPDPQFPLKLHYCRYERVGTPTFYPHWHEHMEFLYIVEGRARISCNADSYDVGPGDLIVVNCADLHHGVCLSDRLFYYAVIFDPDLLHSHRIDSAEAKFITPIVRSRIRFANRVTGDAAIKDSLDELIREYEKKDFAYELSVKSCLYRLLAAMLRGHVAESMPEGELASRIRRLTRIEPVLQHIEANYAKRLDVETLAGIAGMSRYHFSRVFKELTSRSVTDYVNFVRIGRCEQELRYTNKTISEIALDHGFSDIYYFSRLFKSYRGVSPSSLRRRTSPA
ncbi:AraC family transcriptional regulator [Cohnella sp. JJ-181]|uniref:AraC family transcriptional regulator n=1 Tax=Cohnella rhizoplanae TaxID=2974897 RepID=UPI0022FF79C8|nr:AraC family transcriptional regulator [Cohnella sp. JJ-181]CAI6083526.1 HTH-type transcriptional activator RhaR [Cohnella sp. JJ-181]